MRKKEYRLHDGPLLRRLMDCPPPGQLPYTVRSLAAATGLSPSKIQKLISGERPTCDAGEANSVASRFSLRREALFSPSSSTSVDGDEGDDTDGPR